MKSRQRGAFPMACALLLVGILLAMLIIPVWIQRGNGDKMNASVGAEQARNATAPSCATHRHHNAPSPVG